MTSVSGITSRVSSVQASRRVAEPSSGGADTVTGRAIIALNPVVRDQASPPLSRRPRADFLAHLIATAQHMPQTREKRRAEPDEVLQTYEKARAAGRPALAARIERTA